MKKLLGLALLALSSAAWGAHEIPAIPPVVEGGSAAHIDHAIVIAVNEYIYKWIFFGGKEAVVIDADVCAADMSCISLVIELREKHVVSMIDLGKELHSPRTILVPQEAPPAS